MPQTGFRQPVMPQPAIGMPYPGMNTIWNPLLNQQSILVAS